MLYLLRCAQIAPVPPLIQIPTVYTCTDFRLVKHSPSSCSSSVCWWEGSKSAPDPKSHSHMCTSDPFSGRPLDNRCKNPPPKVASLHWQWGRTAVSVVALTARKNIYRWWFFWPWTNCWRMKSRWLQWSSDFLNPACGKASNIHWNISSSLGLRNKSGAQIRTHTGTKWYRSIINPTFE